MCRLWWVAMWIPSPPTANGAICSSSASNMSMMTPFPKGLSSAQAPDAGVKMINKGYVLLTVSRGPQNVKMPGLVGSNLDFALKTLGDMGIRYELVETEEYAPGIVEKPVLWKGRPSTRPRTPSRSMSVWSPVKPTKKQKTDSLDKRGVRTRSDTPLFA